MNTSDANRLMKLAKLCEQIAIHIGTANIKKQFGQAEMHDERIRKYVRWSVGASYAIQLELLGIQARAKYQSTYVTAG